MDIQPLVVILGDSLLMEGVAVSLADVQALRIVRVDSKVYDIWQHVELKARCDCVRELQSSRSAGRWLRETMIWPSWPPIPACGGCGVLRMVWFR